ncbi:unnamed protein product [Gongylonema pulchrum]|uniref:Uncharacterized protein n=1 Tax=Gongylonema pulchrum TaxID=637853 RepID=A0A183CUW1_9BILA|nr:unnamed protein product [Gongylonema pulchrum]
MPHLALEHFNRSKTVPKPVRPPHLDAKSIAILIAPSDRECLVRKTTILRPTRPPPPPPPAACARTALHQAMPQIHTISCSSLLKQPPPLPVKPQSPLLEAPGTSDDIYELPNTVRKR